MNINELIKIIKKNIQTDIELENIDVKDKSFLHKNHKGNQKDKFHLKNFLKSKKLGRMNKIKANKIIYKILDNEIKTSIHSLQILIK